MLPALTVQKAAGNFLWQNSWTDLKILNPICAKTLFHCMVWAKCMLFFFANATRQTGEYARSKKMKRKSNLRGILHRRVEHIYRHRQYNVIYAQNPLSFVSAYFVRSCYLLKEECRGLLLSNYTHVAHIALPNGRAATACKTMHFKAIMCLWTIDFVNLSLFFSSNVWNSFSETSIQCNEAQCHSAAHQHEPLGFSSFYFEIGSFVPFSETCKRKNWRT